VTGIPKTHCDKDAISSHNEGYNHDRVKNTLSWLWDQANKPLILRDPGGSSQNPHSAPYFDAYLFTRATFAYAALIQASDQIASDYPHLLPGRFYYDNEYTITHVKFSGTCIKTVARIWWAYPQQQKDILTWVPRAPNT